MAPDLSPRPLRLRPLPRLTPEAFDAAGWGWLGREVGADYLADHALVVHPDDADALESAANAVYDRLVDAADLVIESKALATLGIPPALHRLIEHTWADDRHWHVLSRFDFTGGLDGTPPRLLECNADTPTSIPETAVVQWAQARAAGWHEADQVNLLFERLAENLGRWRAKWPDLTPTMAVVYVGDAGEDAINAHVVAEAAREAGFAFAEAVPVDRLTLSAGEGAFVPRDDGGWQRVDFVYKFVPWEWIAWDEPEMLRLLEGLIVGGHTAVANPPYALVLQSKALLADAWAVTGGHPNLLRTSRTPFHDAAGTVEKVVLGREGANVRIEDRYGRLLSRSEGIYADQMRVYQTFAPLPADADGRRYQAGVFFAHEACALGVRRGDGLILDDAAAFVPHVVDADPDDAA